MNKEKGRIEVITGPMFSGKSDELIRRVRRAEYAKRKALVFKPEVDDRRGEDSVNTYDGLEIEAISVSKSIEIEGEVLGGDADWVGIDEAQFFDDELPEVADRLAKKGKRVIIAGLAADFKNNPFGPMDDLVRDAEEVTKLNAHCEVCGEEASRTQRLVDGEPPRLDDPVVVVGEEEYRARCRLHHEVLPPKGEVLGSDS